MKAPVDLSTTPQNVVVDVPRKVLKLNKNLLIGAAVGTVVGVASTVVVTKVRNRNKVTVDVPDSPADAS